MMKSQHICSPFARALKQQAERIRKGELAVMRQAIAERKANSASRWLQHYVSILSQ